MPLVPGAAITAEKKRLENKTQNAVINREKRNRMILLPMVMDNAIMGHIVKILITESRHKHQKTIDLSTAQIKRLGFKFTKRIKWVRTQILNR